MKLHEIKFIVDVGVGKVVEEFLRSRGADVLSVRAVDPRMTDREILQYAKIERRMILTMDKDFGELVFHSKISHSGVLLLRMEEATGPEKARVLDYILLHYSKRIQGKFCVYHDKKIRIRD